MEKLREHMNIINRRLHKIQSPFAKPSTVVPQACGSWMLERDCSVGDGESLGLIHGDLNYNNVIVKDGKIVGITDWERACFTAWESARRLHQGFFESDYSSTNEHIWAGVYDESDTGNEEEAR